jgi:hypothetical protein
LFMLWNRRTENTGSLKVYGAYLKMVFISIPIGFILNWAGTEIYPPIWHDTLSGNVLICTISSASFAVLIISLGYLLNINEIKEVTKLFAGKFFKQKSR